MTLVATGDFDDYAMDAELRENAARLDGEPRWRFGPAGRSSKVLKASTFHTQYDLQIREFSCIKMFQCVGFIPRAVLTETITCGRTAPGRISAGGDFEIPMTPPARITHSWPREAYSPELFPTPLRATGSSVCFNVGRVVGAAILIVRGTLGSALGLRGAVVAMSSLFWIELIIRISAPQDAGKRARGVSNFSSPGPSGRHKPDVFIEVALFDSAP